MRQIKFTEDHDWNTDGSQHGKRSNRAGDVIQCGDRLADMLVYEQGVAEFHETGPTQTKANLKIDFGDLPGAAALKAAGYDSLEGVAGASDDELLAVKGIGPATLEDIRGLFN